MRMSDAGKSFAVVAIATVTGLAAVATLASASPSGRGMPAASPCPSASASPTGGGGITTILSSILPGGGGSSSPSPTPKPTQTGSTAAPVAFATDSPTASTSASTAPSATVSASKPPSSSPSSGSCGTSGAQEIKSTVTIDLHRHLHFTGKVKSSEKDCYQKRDVVLKKVRKGKDADEGTDITNKKGEWAIIAETKTGGGKYYAVATKKVLRPNTDNPTICKPARSKTVKAG